MRAFVAILLPVVLRKRMARMAKGLAEHARGIKWVETENLHITMKFLGEVDEQATDSVIDALSRVAAQFAPFDIDITGVLAVPNPKRARMIWIDISECSELISLAAAIESELCPLGFVKEDRPFKAHITLGRVRDNGRVKTDIEALAQEKVGELNVGGIALMKSKLRTDGPVYSIIKDVPFTACTDDGPVPISIDERNPNGQS